MEAYHASLKEQTRARVPFDWAAMQGNLGNALRVLGELENDSERLKQAVQAHQAALEEFTRERRPLDWAKAQNNLGIALHALGERETGTVRLHEAVEACWVFR